VTVERLAFGTIVVLAFCLGLGDIARVTTFDTVLLIGIRGLLPLAIGLALLAGLLRRRLPAFPSQLAFPALAWFAVLVGAAGLAPTNRLDAVASLERPASGALLAWAVWALCRTQAQWRLLAQAAALGGLGIALVGLAEASGIPIVRDWLASIHDGSVPIGDVPRVASTLSHPNEAAMLLEVSLPLLVAWAWTAPRRWRVPLTVAAMCNLAAMVLTFSRAGVVAGVAGLAIMAWLSISRGNRRALVSLGGVALAVPAALVCAAMANQGLDRRLSAELTLTQSRTATIQHAPLAADLLNGGIQPATQSSTPTVDSHEASTNGADPAGQRVQSALLDRVSQADKRVAPGPDDLTVAAAAWSTSSQATTPVTQAPAFDAAPPSRTRFWTAALDMARDHPWLGVGPDNFRWRFADYSGVPANNLGIHAHDQYLEALADTGVLGLLTLGWLLLSLFRTALDQARRAASGSADWPWRAAILASSSAWLLHALLDDFERFWPASVGFWLLAGLNLSIPAPPQPASRHGAGNATSARPAHKKRTQVAARVSAAADVLALTAITTAWRAARAIRVECLLDHQQHPVRKVRERAVSHPCPPRALRWRPVRDRARSPPRKAT
jgi:hypothetical protein